MNKKHIAVFGISCIIFLFAISSVFLNYSKQKSNAGTDLNRKTPLIAEPKEVTIENDATMAVIQKNRNNQATVKKVADGFNKNDNSLRVDDTELDSEYDNSSAWMLPNYFDIIKAFGYTNSKYNTGIDIGAPIGTQIVSASIGTVVQASDTGNGYGKCVVIRDTTHDYLYGNMDSISVKVGDSINTSDKLGLVGNTGLSTIPHLHFGISIGDFHNGNWIDPITVVNPK